MEERNAEYYRRLAEESPKGSLLQRAYNALVVWWVGSSEGQCIGKTGEVLPVVDVLTEIAYKLASGELVEAKDTS